jgi:assimilatory nitrate reductase catalytic subunit
MHWTRQNTRSSHVNALTLRTTDPVSGQPALKSGSVAARRYEAKWYGYLASVNAIDLDGLTNGEYAAKARTVTGYQAEIAGLHAAPSGDALTALFRQMTGRTLGEIAQVSDVKTGQTRLALTHEGQLVAALFMGPAPVSLSRAAVINTIGTQTPALMALAGRASAGMVDDGAIVCACFSVGVNALTRAIEAGAQSVAELGERTCAGTNCGSCRPELAAFLKVARPRIAAE